MRKITHLDKSKSKSKSKKGKGSAVKGWSKLSPSIHERNLMWKKCGKKCFLGPVTDKIKSFPICNKGTCKINKKGILAANMRAREWGSKKMRQSKKHTKSVYKNIAKKSRRILK
jgi:hypothetical protein